MWTNLVLSAIFAIQSQAFEWDEQPLSVPRERRATVFVIHSLKGEDAQPLTKQRVATVQDLLQSAGCKKLLSAPPNGHRIDEEPSTRESAQ